MTPRLILLRGAPGTGKTTICRWLATSVPGLVVIDVDDIKIERRNSTAQFHPDDFIEAGRRARVALDEGKDVLLAEFFNRDDTIELAIQPTGLALDSDRVVSIWLNCDVEVAVRRKEDQLPPEVVRITHAVAVQRSNHPREVMVDTTHAPAAEIADRILQVLAERRAENAV